MANKIVLKKSSVAAKVPVAGDLDFGELAINYTDGKLYFKKADNTIDAFTTAAASAPVTSVGGNIGDITDAQLLASIKNVDGTGSGLDADTLDGNHASAFYLASNPNGYTSNTGTVTSVGATAPLVSSGGTDPSISIPAANSTTNGYMTSAYAAKLDGIAAGATANTGTVTSVSGTGTVSGLTLTGTVTGSGSLTLGGTLSLTSGQVTTALGYTPYNSTNPDGYITSSSSISGTSAGLSGGDSTFYARIYNSLSGDLNTYSDPGLYSAEYTGTTNRPVGSNGHYIQISDAGGTDVKTQWYFESTGVTPYMRLMWGNGNWKSWQALLTSGNVSSYALVQNTWQGSKYFGTDGAIYGTIFYDSNNSGYYSDPNGTSRLGTVNADTLRSYNNIYLDNNYGSSIIGVYSSVRYQGVFSMGDAYKLALDGTTTGNLYGIAWSHPNAGGVAGNLNTHGALILENGGFLAAISGSIRSRDDMRSPIFYDSNNTGYYSDPSSVSYMYGLTLAGGSYFRPNNWIQLDSSYGLYWPNHYSAHLHANDLSSYTQIALRGYKNSYGGIYDQYSAVNGFMYDSGGNGGVYREANGRWYFYYHLGNDCMGIGTSSTSSTYSLYLNKGVYAQSRIDATIFYDTNNTGYYVDPNSTTYIYYLQSATTVRADSDRRLKDNIKPIENALDKVRKLQGCTYTRKDMVDKTKVYMGMIAQDVLPIVPEVVGGSEEGKYSLGYAEMVPLLNEAIKEQDLIILQQEARIAKLEALVNKLIG